MKETYTPSIDPEQRLREIAVSDLTTISVNSLQQMRVNGDGPPYRKVGRTVVYKRREVLTWVDEYEAMGNTPVGGAQNP